MIFKKLFSYLKDVNKKKRKIVDRIQNVLPYLRKGFYIVDCSSKIVFHIGAKKDYKFERSHTLTGITNKENISLFRTILNKRLIYINNKNKQHFFTICILSYDHFILLSPNDKIVLTIHKNKSKRDEILCRRASLVDDHFNVPELLDYDKRNTLLIAEKYILKQNYNPETGIISLFNFFIKKDIENYCNCTTKDLSKQFNGFINSEIEALISKCDFKKIICHGDCNYFNYIFDGDSYYFIDYDRAGEHFFFCDCIFYIFWQFYILKDESLINNYFKGEYDPFLQALFNKFNSEYNIKYRYYYILLTIFDISNNQVNSDMINTLEEYVKNYATK